MILVLYRSFIMMILMSLLLDSSLFAQLNIGANDTINPGVAVSLRANFGETATGITIEDDGVEGPFPIGFDFSFFGITYNQFYIGANGWISFSPDINAAGHREAFAVPSADNFIPKNCILGPFQDLIPTGERYIFYKTTGDTSSHRLIVMWCQTPMYGPNDGCQDSLATFQIILNEGTNTIENHIMRKPACPDKNNLATQGVQNETGYIGYAVPGRNATSWTARNDAWKYIPVSADSFEIIPVAYHLEPIIPEGKVQYSWFKGSELISSETSVVVTPDETTDYILVIKICQGQEFRDTVRVVVIPYIPNAFTPDQDGLNDIFKITGLPVDNITGFNLQIYNRWGKMIFSTTDILLGWDGTCNGQKCPAGVYVWVIHYMDKKNKVTNKGTLMLIR